MDMRQCGRVFAWFGTCAVAMLASRYAHATNYNVTTSSACTLSLAIQAVNTGVAQGACGTPSAMDNTITMAAGTYTLTTTQVISSTGTGTLTIDGAGIASTFIRSQLSSGTELFNVAGSANMTQVLFKEVTIDKSSSQTAPQVTGIFAWGDAENKSRVMLQSCRVAGHTWSGLFLQDASFTVDDSRIENNFSPGDGGGIGIQAIIGRAGGFVHRSIINGNMANGNGGGVWFAGNSPSQLINTTLSGNTATHGGGVAYASPNPSDGYFNIVESTIAQNFATASGGGIHTPPLVENPGDPNNYHPNIDLGESIVANNPAQAGGDWDGHVHTITNGLIADILGADIHVEQGMNLLDVDPMLDPVLRDMGGPMHTRVHRLLPGSPAIDFVQTSSSGEDQRQVKRPQGGASDAGASDLGAYEECRKETEALTVNAKSNVPHVQVTSSSASAGKGMNLQATAINQFVTYATPSPLANGTYKVIIGFKKATNGGKFQFSVSSSPSGTFTPVGSVQDGRGSSAFTTVTLPNVSFGSTSPKFMKFTVTGTSGTGFQLYPDFVELIKQ